LSQLYKNKVMGLEKQEEDFNANVQVVVESDEQQIKLNELIIGLKKNLEEITSKLDLAKTEFK
jgi:hypothetical protein